MSPVLLSFATLFLIFHFSLIVCDNYNLESPKNPYGESDRKCQVLRMSQCSELYNLTIFPNHMSHTTLEEAAKEMEVYTPLLKINCSPSLRLFLCALLFPPCTIMLKPLDPCRSLCQQNYDGCAPIMNKFSFLWPAMMECSKFPENELCIREKNDPQSGKPSDISPSSYECATAYKVNPNFGFHWSIGAEKVNDCGIPCHEFHALDEGARTFARIWIVMWSALCVASTLFTVLTFLIDMGRFQYPERPIIFLSACYLMISITYTIGFFLKDKVACSEPAQLTGIGRTHPVITQGTKFEGCIILFMALYFFSMASSIWWVILTLTWYLAAKCHWAHEAIAQNSQYFHFVAWAIPAGKTIALLAWGQVDGDPLSGVCFTGFSNPWAMRGFVILPLCLYLLVGTGFLLAGYLSMFRIRHIVKIGGQKTDKFDKLIMRIGIFSVLYIVPAVIVIGCYVYETVKRDEWMKGWYRAEVCPKIGFHKPYCQSHDQLLPSRTTRSKPNFEVVMIKYLMTVMVGITGGIWIWSGKTLVSWHRFFVRLCHCGSAPRKAQGQVIGAAQEMTLANAWYPNVVKPPLTSGPDAAAVALLPVGRSVGPSYLVPQSGCGGSYSQASPEYTHTPWMSTNGMKGVSV